MIALRDLRFLLVPVGIASAWHFRDRALVTHVTASHSATSGPERLPALVGTWRVTKFCSNDSTGHLSEPYGPHPTGYFVYAPGGQLSIQAMRTPPVRPFAGGDDQPTDTERRTLLRAYFGYYGTYTVTSDSTVVHHVQGGTIPSYIGTDQARQYQIRGDTLTIGGSRTTWPCRELIRVGE